MTGTVTQFSGGVTGYTNPNIQGTADYLIWLCGQFQVQALAFTGGGGTVIPINPSASVPLPLEFVVDGTTSSILNGGNTITLPLFIGYNMAFNRGGQPQTQVSTESTYFTWNRSTGVFTCSPAAVTGELFSLNPV